MLYTFFSDSKSISVRVTSKDTDDDSLALSGAEAEWSEDEESEPRSDADEMAEGDDDAVLLFNVNHFISAPPTMEYSILAFFPSSASVARSSPTTEPMGEFSGT